MVESGALESAGDDSELERLRVENARLTALLTAHGIRWQAVSNVPISPSADPLTTEQKVALFGRLFRGRTDVYPVRWESKAGKTGYSPACSNEWRVGICEKPRIKCSDCGHRNLIPLSDETLFDHLAGKHTVTLPLESVSHSRSHALACRG